MSAHHLKIWGHQGKSSELAASLPLRLLQTSGFNMQTWGFLSSLLTFGTSRTSYNTDWHDMNGIYFLGRPHLTISLMSSWQFNWHVFDEFLTIFMMRLLTKSLTECLMIFWLLWAGDTLNLIFVSFWICFSRNIWFKHRFEKVYPIWMAPVDDSWSDLLLVLCQFTKCLYTTFFKLKQAKL